MTLALRRLLDDPDALATARRGAERARDELTWDASAAAHLDLYASSLMLRRGRFGELVERQLDLFAADESGLLDEAAEADAAWTRAPGGIRGAFGEYQLIVDAIADRLYDVREAYAASLDEETAEEYRSAFNRAATKRFRSFAALLED